jgi:hypothetical protein
MENAKTMKMISEQHSRSMKNIETYIENAVQHGLFNIEYEMGYCIHDPKFPSLHVKGLVKHLTELGYKVTEKPGKNHYTLSISWA